MLASRFARRVASQSLRSASRVFARPVSPAARRFATTDAAHGAKESSDTPWMVRPSHVSVLHLTDPYVGLQIGSALVFGPVVRTASFKSNRAR